ncbi:hypothetical protein HYD81_02940 [Mycoplasmopsis bovis]|nr:hypothetical protein HYD81_02940 [Mycoplasmopsis bovis]
MKNQLLITAINSAILVKQDQNNDSVDNLINEIYKEKQKLLNKWKFKYKQI